MSHEIQIGQTLDGRFKILTVLTRSGMATIFEALDTDSGGSVAVKVPLFQFECDAGFFARFQREEEIGLKLHHPAIMRFVPVAAKSRPYIVTEYLRGQTLGQRLRNVRPLPIDEALAIGGKICAALEYLHGEGVIHRDLKPDNIMLCADGSLRLLDFGIAKSDDLRRITFAGFSSLMGTPDYMAPEQVKGRRGDARTDIYCLGAILYEMLTGLMPFQGDNPFALMNARLVGDAPSPRTARPEIPPEVEEIVLRALEREPAARYRSAAELSADLKNPQNVKVVGRALRLQAPAAWKVFLSTYKVPLASMLIPIIAFLLFFLLVRRH
jgi:serine/threonine-protein kinase